MSLVSVRYFPASKQEPFVVDATAPLYLDVASAFQAEFIFVGIDRNNTGVVGLLGRLT